jgi:hypothetical protein
VVVRLLAGRVALARDARTHYGCSGLVSLFRARVFEKQAHGVRIVAIRRRADRGDSIRTRPWRKPAGQQSCSASFVPA